MNPDQMMNAILAYLLDRHGGPVTIPGSELRKWANRVVRVDPAATHNGVVVSLFTEDPMVLARKAKEDLRTAEANLANNPRDPQLHAQVQLHAQQLGAYLAGFTPEQLKAFAETGHRPPTDEELAPRRLRLA